MPRQTEVRVKQRGVVRVYQVWYADDPPARAEAVDYFQSLGKWPWLSGSALPRSLDSMPIEEANAWLRDHPLPDLHDWLVSADGGEQVRDDDLQRLEHLPELTYVELKLDHLTDAGVCHLRNLRELESLGLQCPRLTDASLDVIRELRTLRTLDLQLSRGISRQKCKALVADMRISEFWLPWPMA
jgi:hypothetical protein